MTYYIEKDQETIWDDADEVEVIKKYYHVVEKGIKWYKNKKLFVLIGFHIISGILIISEVDITGILFGVILFTIFFIALLLQDTYDYKIYSANTYEGAKRYIKHLERNRRK